MGDGDAISLAGWKPEGRIVGREGRTEKNKIKGFGRGGEKKGWTKTTRKRGAKPQRGAKSNVYRIALTLNPAVAAGRRKPSCSSTVLSK